MVLKSLQPRKVSSADVLQPIIIYTDGAFGDGLADWGAILLDVATGTLLLGYSALLSFGCLAWLSGRTTYLSDRDVCSFVCQVAGKAPFAWPQGHSIH